MHLIVDGKYQGKLFGLYKGISHVTVELLIMYLGLFDKKNKQNNKIHGKSLLCIYIKQLLKCAFKFGSNLKFNCIF